MENFDPMGIYTYDSAVVAPSQTLANSEHYRPRECAETVARHLGVGGECNDQYAVEPQIQEFRIMEVNTRLSLSSPPRFEGDWLPSGLCSGEAGAGQRPGEAAKQCDALHDRVFRAIT